MLLALFLPLPAHGWASSYDRVAVAAAVTVCFAVLARQLRGVTVSGAVAGGMACFLLFVGAGPGGFAALGALFVMTWGTTRLGHRRKVALGVAEAREGRNAWQILANLSVAALGSCVFAFSANRVWLLVSMAALSEAATDTVASEIGQSRAENAHMITNWQQVPSGTDGGVTLAGSVAGFAAGTLLASVAAIAGVVRLRQVWILTATGFAGMLADSVLGATLQRRGWIDNQTVNLFGTLAAGALAAAITLSL